MTDYIISTDSLMALRYGTQLARYANYYAVKSLENLILNKILPHIVCYVNMNLLNLPNFGPAKLCHFSSYIAAISLSFEFKKYAAKV